MLSGALSLEAWLIGALLIAVIVLFEIVVKRDREAKRATAIKASRLIPADAPIAIVANAVLKAAQILTESSKPKPPSPSSPPSPEPEWNKLYVPAENGKDLRLRFLPDSDDVEGHTLLLVLYGYKVCLGLNRIPIHHVVAEATRVMREAPNASFRERAFQAQNFMYLLEPEKFGRSAISRGEVQRVSLSTGGSFELTWLGIDKAKALAMDLITRA